MRIGKDISMALNACDNLCVCNWHRIQFMWILSMMEINVTCFEFIGVAFQKENYFTVLFFVSFVDANLCFKDFCRWPDEPFEEMDSTLAVQQYIQQLIKKDPSNIEAILTMPESQDEGVWKYEHLR